MKAKKSRRTVAAKLSKPGSAPGNQRTHARSSAPSTSEPRQSGNGTHAAVARSLRPTRRTARQFCSDIQEVDARRSVVQVAKRGHIDGDIHESSAAASPESERHSKRETQNRAALVAPFSSGPVRQTPPDSHPDSAHAAQTHSAGNGQFECDTHEGHAIPPPKLIGRRKARVKLEPNAAMPNAAQPLSQQKALEKVHNEWRLRQDLVQAQGNLDRQIKHVVRRMLGLPKKSKVSDKDVEKVLSDTVGSLTLQQGEAEHIRRFCELRDITEGWRRGYEGELLEKAKYLPGYDFMQNIKGFGEIGLIAINAESGIHGIIGDPPYTVSKLCKRFGLHVYKGKAPSTWRRAGDRGVTAEEWLEEIGYSPKRRAVMYWIVDSLLRQKTRYSEIYHAEKERQMKKAAAEGLEVVSALEFKKFAKNIAKLREFARTHRSLKHIDNRARRYVAKRLLKDLWRASRGQTLSDDQFPDAPAPSASGSPLRSIDHVPSEAMTPMTTAAEH
jgi:hypothetical protein